MGIGGIGSTPSFWQQDQAYWGQQQSETQSLNATNSLISAMGNAMVTEAKGLASIANGEALNRVNSELVAAIQSVLSGNSGSSSSSSGGVSGSPSASSSGSSAAPATAIGTAALTVGTTLATLGIPAGGAITISSGGNVTTYASTGSDTVGDLISAINVQLPTNAAVKASLNSRGNLVLTSRNDTNTITVGDVYASNIGFGVGNNTFKPTKAAANNSSTTSTSPTTASTSPASSSSTTKTASSGSGAVIPTLASEMASSAASLLSDSGVAGSVVNMLA